MKIKYGIILSYEGSFASAVSTNMTMRKPLTAWHFLVPFIFVFDFIRMKGEAESFTKNYLSVKKLALDAAFDINRGEDRQHRIARIEDETRDKLISQKLYSWQAHHEQLTEVNLLVEHYGKLLEAEGDSYQSLVKSAYETRDSYESFLHQLTSVEREIDQAIIVTLGETEEIGEQMLMKHAVVDKIRAKETDKFFPRTSQD